MLSGKTEVIEKSLHELVSEYNSGCQPFTREVLVYDSSLMRSWIANTIDDDEKMPHTEPEISEISPNEILETVQSVFNFLGGVFNFLAEREKNSQD